MLSARRCGSAELLLVGAMLLGVGLVACFDDKQIRFDDGDSAVSPGGAAGRAGAGGAGAAVSTLPPVAGGASSGGTASGGAASGGTAGSVSPVALPSDGVTSLDLDAGAAAGGAGFDGSAP